MFCKYCWREIVEDSVFCSYCGKHVDTAQTEELSKTKTSNIGSFGAHPIRSTKRCKGCGKELPASISSDICAICSIHQRNKQLKKERQTQQTKPSSPYIPSKQSANLSQTNTATSKKSTVPKDASNTSKTKKGCGCFLLIVFLIFIFIFFFARILFVFFLHENDPIPQQEMQGTFTQTHAQSIACTFTPKYPRRHHKDTSFSKVQIPPIPWIFSDDLLSSSQGRMV